MEQVEQVGGVFREPVIGLQLVQRRGRRRSARRGRDPATPRRSAGVESPPFRRRPCRSATRGLRRIEVRHGGRRRRGGPPDISGAGFAGRLARAIRSARRAASRSRSRAACGPMSTRGGSTSARATTASPRRCGRPWGSIRSAAPSSCFARAGGRHRQPHRGLGLRHRRELAIDAGEFLETGAHPRHGLDDALEHRVALGALARPLLPRPPCHGSHHRPEVPECGAKRGLRRRRLLHEERPLGARSAGLPRVERRHMNALRPAEAREPGDAAGVMAIGLDAHGGEGRSDVGPIPPVSPSLMGRRRLRSGPRWAGLRTPSARGRRQPGVAVVRPPDVGNPPLPCAQPRQRSRTRNPMQRPRRAPAPTRDRTTTRTDAAPREPAVRSPPSSRPPAPRAPRPGGRLLRVARPRGARPAIRRSSRRSCGCWPGSPSA